MASTAGGPLGGLARNPEFWDRLMQSFGSIGRFLTSPPSETNLGENALRDVGQIGALAPLGMPGAVGLTVLGEGMKPPWEQSTTKIPLRGLQTAGGLAELAFRDPQMLQKLATSSLLAAPSALSRAFHEHPVLTPLMAVPILPGGGRFSHRWSDHWNNLIRQGLKNGMSEQEAISWGAKQLQNAQRRLSAREARVKRKLTQHEVEDVIQQSLSEGKPSGPYVGDAAEASKRKYQKWSDKDLQDRLDQLSTAPPLYQPIKDALTFEIRRRRGAPQSPAAQARSREELLHEFEEGPAGPLPDIPVQRQSALLDRIAREINARRSDYSALSKDDLARRQAEYAADIQRVLDRNGLPSDIYAFRLLEYMDEAQRRGLPIQNRLSSEVLHKIIRERQGVEGAAPLPSGIDVGRDLLRQVPLAPQKQNWQQGIVARLNAFGAGASQEWWENGQRFVRGPKGWMMDPNTSLPPTRREQGQYAEHIIHPRPEGAFKRYLKKHVWDEYDRIMGNPQFIDHSILIDGALFDLKQATGRADLAQLWLMEHILFRQARGQATPAEVVWLELQRGRGPGDEGMAGASR